MFKYADKVLKAATKKCMISIYWTNKEMWLQEPKQSEVYNQQKTRRDWTREVSINCLYKLLEKNKVLKEQYFGDIQKGDSNSLSFIYRLNFHNHVRTTASKGTKKHEVKNWTIIDSNPQQSQTTYKVEGALH